MIKLADDNEQEKLILNIKKIELENFYEDVFVKYKEIQNLFLNII